MKRAQGTGIAQMLKSNLHLIGEENARRHRDLMDKAILRSDFDHMVALISRGAADPDFETINGFTPLIRACFCRNIDAVRTIISLGADPKYETRKYETAMIWAASVDGGSQLLLAMAESAEERNIKIDFDNETKLGVTALMAACEVQNLEAIDVLIENLKVNPDRKNGKGLTALMCACRFGKREAAFKLLNSGAKLNLKDRKGRDAVAWTKEAGHYELAKTLTEESWRWKRETSKRDLFRASQVVWGKNCGRFCDFDPRCSGLKETGKCSGIQAVQKSTTTTKLLVTRHGIFQSPFLSDKEIDGTKQKIPSVELRKSTLDYAQTNP